MQTPGTSRFRLAFVLLLSLALLACGEREPVNHPAAPPSAAGDGAGEAWWLLEAPLFEVISGGATPAEVSASTGSLWMLEYSDSTHTVRLVADRAGGLFSELSAASPEVGRMTIEDVEVILRQHPGRPEEGIAPSVGAEWTDGDVFISFGGAGVTEPVLRELLSQVRRVTRADWEAVAATIPPPAEEGDTPPAP